jgi:hypothetical protein
MARRKRKTDEETKKERKAHLQDLEKQHQRGKDQQEKQELLAEHVELQEKQQE